MELLQPDIGLVLWKSLLVLIFWVLPTVLSIKTIQKHEFKDAISKLMWILAVVFIPLFGAILFFVIGKSQKIKTV
jgi:heme/copper-type cytochrome/quinol oxidase subunit 2